MELGLCFHVQENPTRLLHDIRVVVRQLLIDLQFGCVHNGLVEDAHAGGTFGEETGGNTDRVHGEKAQGMDGREEERGECDDQSEKEHHEEIYSQPIEAAFTR